MIYFVKTPGWVRWLYKTCIWKIPTSDQSIYLTFDDGPHPVITAFVLDELKKYSAKATFFCIGKNVELFPEMFKRIIDEGHAIGNHTYHHVNGWKTEDAEYLNDIEEASKIIDSNLFRPPYGRITKFQLNQLSKPRFKLTPIMWSVLSGDFDVHLSKESCRDHVLMNTESGSIVVFHDSEKANERLRFALPEVLKYFSKKGFQFKKISSDILNQE